MRYDCILPPVLFMYHILSDRNSPDRNSLELNTLTRRFLLACVLFSTVFSTSLSIAQDAYERCVADELSADNPNVNDPPILQPLNIQTGVVNQEIRFRLELCDPEGEAPGTIAANMPAGATLPDNGDGTRSFVWTPDQALETEITFTVYEESDRRIRSSIVVPFVVNEANPLPRQDLAITLSSSVPKKGTSENAEFPVSGRVIALSGVSLPGEIYYSVSAANSNSHDSGVLPVADSGDWQGQVQLLPGQNAIAFTGDNGRLVQHIAVTYNPGYAFGGLLDLAPDVAYVGETRLFTARIALNDPQTDGSTIQLINADTSEVVAILSDDGNLANGDEIESDGVFSALFAFTADAVGTLDYQARINLPDGRIALSESSALITAERFNPAELIQITQQQSLLEAALVSADEQDRQILLQSMAEELASDPLVADSGISEGGTGIWIVYENGMAGAVYAPAEGTKGSQISSPQAPDSKTSISIHTDASSTVSVNSKKTVSRAIAKPEPPAPYSRYCHANKHVKKFTDLSTFNDSAVTSSQISSIDRKNSVESSRVLAIAAQYWDWGEFDDIPQMQRILSDDDCHDVNYIRYNAKGSGSVEDFKNLGSYGAILISSHGDSLYQGIDSDWQQRFGWNGNTGQVVVDSNMLADAENITLYEDDLHAGRLVLWGSSLGITPSFISEYSGTLPNSLVYMSICRGTWNATMASAFLNNGAGTFLGYDNYVTVAFCQDIGPALVNTLLADGQSLQQAFVPEQFDPYASGIVEFDLLGASDLSLQAGEIQNESFEENSLSQAWQVDGDARLVQSLGEFRPTDGSAMAIISTGLGFTRTSGNLSQQICLCNGTTHIGFDWNFLSEEWLEYVGSGFQDAFTVTLSSTTSNDTATLFSANIDSLANNVVPVNNAFDQNDVYATGWQSYSGQIPDPLNSKSVKLQFAVTDTGDSIFDSAVLLDNIRVHCAIPTQASLP